MRTLFTLSAILLTQLVWLSSLASSFAHSSPRSSDSIHCEGQTPPSSIVKTELEEDEVLHHASAVVVLSDRPVAFHRPRCGRLIVCAQIDARGCRPPPFRA